MFIAVPYVCIRKLRPVGWQFRTFHQMDRINTGELKMMAFTKGGEVNHGDHGHNQLWPGTAKNHIWV
jgi:hypothetical protein